MQCVSRAKKLADEITQANADESLTSDQIFHLRRQLCLLDSQNNEGLNVGSQLGSYVECDPTNFKGVQVSCTASGVCEQRGAVRTRSFRTACSEPLSSRSWRVLSHSTAVGAIQSARRAPLPALPSPATAMFTSHPLCSRRDLCSPRVCAPRFTGQRFLMRRRP